MLTTRLRREGAASRPIVRWSPAGSQTSLLLTKQPRHRRLRAGTHAGIATGVVEQPGLAGGESLSSRIPLLEREAQVAHLRAMLDRTCDGSGGATLFEGAPGSGKSRLLDVAAKLAEWGSLTALRATAGELERDLGFGVVRQLFEPLVRRSGPGEGKDRAAAGDLATALLDPERPLPTAPEASTSAAVDALFALCSTFAERNPLLLLVDDVHWCDDGSLHFLVYLARRIGHLPVSLVLTATRGPGPDPALAALTTAAGARVIDLSALSEAASARALEAALGDGVASEFAGACHQISGGNPFLLCELAAELSARSISPTPDAAGAVAELRCEGVRRSALVRLARLPEQARAVARAVAVFDSGAELRHAAALAEVDVAQAARLVDALVEADLLQATRPLRFRHPLVRTVVYEDIAPSLRAGAHARAARVLSDESAPAEAIARHLMRTERNHDRTTVLALRIAAERAAADGAPESGAVYLRRALAEPPPSGELGDVLAELGVLELRSGSADGVEHAIAAVRESKSPRRRAENLLALAPQLIYTGRPAVAADLLRRALSELEPPASELAQRLELELLVCGQTGADVQVCADRIEELGRLPGSSLAERGLLAFSSCLPFARKRGMTAAESMALAERALAGGALFQSATADWHAGYLAINALMLCDELDRAQLWIERALDDATARGSRLGVLLATEHRAALNFRRGALADAELDARTALAGALEGGYPLLEAYALGYLVVTLTEQGKLEAADSLLRQHGIDGDVGDTPLDALTLESRCLLRLAQGRIGDALEDARKLRIRARQSGHRCHHASITCLPLVFASLEKAKPGREAATLEQARSFGAPRSLGIALRMAGLLQPGEAGRRLLEEAVQVLRPSPSRLEYAKALVEYGSALRRANRRAAAREPLNEGLELARCSGADRLAERAHVELRASGARLRRNDVGGVDSLTPSEQRIVRMAADGLSNPHIAQALFVTLKTVETHLSNAYRKLDVQSRSELPAVLAADER